MKKTMNQIVQTLEKNASGKKVLSFFVITNIVYLFMLLVTIPKTMKFSKGMKLLDMLPTGYNIEYVNTLFSALGENGREIYLVNQIPVDMLYPFLFGFTYSLLILYFLKKIDKFKTPFIYLSFLPIIAAISDYIENFGIILMLNTYPNISRNVVNTTNAFSILKSTTTSMFFISLIVVLIIFTIKRFKNIA